MSGQLARDAGLVEASECHANQRMIESVACNAALTSRCRPFSQSEKAPRSVFAGSARVAICGNGHERKT